MALKPYNPERHKRWSLSSSSDMAEHIIYRYWCFQDWKVLVRSGPANEISHLVGMSPYIIRNMPLDIFWLFERKKKQCIYLSPTVAWLLSINLKWWFCCCLFINYCCSHCLCRFCVRSLFCYEALCVLSSFAIISLGKRELVALLLLSWRHVAVVVLCLFLTVTWNGLKCHGCGIS